MNEDLLMSKQSAERLMTATCYICERLADEQGGGVLTDRQNRLYRVAVVLVAQIGAEEIERVSTLMTSGVLMTEVDKSAANKTIYSSLKLVSGAVDNLSRAEGKADIIRKIVGYFMNAHNALCHLSDSGARYKVDNRLVNLFSNDQFRYAVNFMIGAGRKIVELDFVDEETKKRIKSNNIEIKRTLDATDRGTDGETEWNDKMRISQKEE
jgi:hypothetical protein